MGEKGGSILATTNNEIIEVLKTIAPGTPIREGLENILKANRRLTSWRKPSRANRRRQWAKPGACAFLREA